MVKSSIVMVPKISVIIPVYNVEAFLEEALNSIVSQSMRDIEIICVNDGSTDNSAQILQEFSLKDSRVKVFTQKNQGVSAARNTGIQHANGEYIVFFDGDDFYIEKEAFAILYSKMKQDKSDIGIFGYKNLLSGKLYVNCFYSKFREAYPKVGDNNYFDYPIFVHDKIFKADFLKKNNITFNKQIKNAEDFIFSLTCYFYKPRYSIINKIMYVYREDRPNSATNNNIKCVINDFESFKFLYSMQEFRNQPLSFQYRLINRYLNVAIWYIKKFNKWNLVKDSRLLIKFIEKRYSKKDLNRLKSYRKLKLYPITFILQHILSIKTEGENKYFKLLGLNFNLGSKRSKKFIVQDSQILIKKLLKKAYYESSFNKINPINNLKTISLVFSFDNRYCKYFAVTLQSLINLYQYENIQLDIIIITDDLSERNKNILEKSLPVNFHIRFFNFFSLLGVDKESFNQNVGAYWSFNIYYRLFIPFIFSNYTNILYCDSDVIFNAKIDDLFLSNDNKGQIKAVVDGISPIIELVPQESSRLYQMTDILKLKDPSKYINSGVVMFNLNNINVDDYFEKLLAALDIPGLLYNDQDILNVIFENNITFLPLKYNFEWHIPLFCTRDAELYYGKLKEEYDEAYKNPIIIHFTSPIKPWNTPSGVFANIFWRVARSCQFYEEILFDNCNVFNKEQIKNVLHLRRLYLSYLRCKLILFVMPTSKKRSHYKSKSILLKKRIKTVKSFYKN